MKKALKIAGVIPLILIFTVSLTAQRQGRLRAEPQFAGQYKGIGILAVLKVHQEELKVTDEQLKIIKDMMESHQEEMIKVRSEAQLQALELRKLMQDRGNRDYAKIKEALARASAFRNDQIIGRMQFQEKLINVLTPEQKEALKERQNERSRRGRLSMQGRRGNFLRGSYRGMNRDFLRSNTRGLRFRRPPIKRDVNEK